MWTGPLHDTTHVRTMWGLTSITIGFWPNMKCTTFPWVNTRAARIPISELETKTLANKRQPHAVYTQISFDSYPEWQVSLLRSWLPFLTLLPDLEDLNLIWPPASAQENGGKKSNQVLDPGKTGSYAGHASFSIIPSAGSWTSLSHSKNHCINCIKKNFFVQIKVQMDKIDLIIYPVLLW